MLVGSIGLHTIIACPSKELGKKRRVAEVEHNRTTNTSTKH